MGYSINFGPEIVETERGGDYGRVVLEGRLRQALQRLNPQVPASPLSEAFRKLTQPDSPSLVASQLCRAKLKGNRKECGCFEAREIGEYDTCPHGCFYCYAVRVRQLALDRFRQHDPESEFRFPPPAGASKVVSSDRRVQLALFDDLKELS